MDSPEDPTHKTTAQIGLYTHRGQDSRTSCNRPGGLMAYRVCARAHLCMDAQQIVVGLEETAVLRETIVCPASGAHFGE